MVEISNDALEYSVRNFDIECIRLQFVSKIKKEIILAQVEAKYFIHVLKREEDLQKN
jgi:hypothetical protein